jgi:tRNA (cmo5U34)-methyltransferase
MQTQMIDQTLPVGKWEFDPDVTHVFDDMLARSIPQYAVMRQACLDIACQYRQPNTDIVDLGCSRGEAIAELIDKYGAGNRFIGVEVSLPMLEACRSRFEGYINSKTVDIRQLDLRTDYPPVYSSVTLCVLTLQFTPIEYRQRIIRNIYKHLSPGGALILVEKLLGADAELDELMVKLYYGLKAHNGYTQEQIERKRLSLEGVLVPVTARWNEELLKMAGFNHIDCFWRWMNFAGWIAVK